MQVISELEWSAPTTVKTKNGPRDVRQAKPTTNLWTAWATQKAALKALGVSVAKDDKTEQFIVKLWSEAGAPVPGVDDAKMGTFRPATAEEKIEGRTHPVNGRVMDEFPGSEIVGVRDPVPAHEFRPELPPQGYRGMIPKDRFAFELRCAVVRAIETEQCSRTDCIEIMRVIASDLKR